MSASSVKSNLDEVARVIVASRRILGTAKENIAKEETKLNSIGSTYSEMINEINGYVGDDAFEAVCKDELAKLTTEFQALKDEATIAKNSLSTITEF